MLMYDVMVCHKSTVAPYTETHLLLYYGGVVGCPQMVIYIKIRSSKEIYNFSLRSHLNQKTAAHLLSLITAFDTKLKQQHYL
jgi:hypothetical protein